MHSAYPMSSQGSQHGNQYISKPHFFFVSAKGIIFGECNDGGLMKKMQLFRNKIQRREISDTWLHFQQKGGYTASRQSNDLNDEAPFGALYICSSQGHLDIKLWNRIFSKL